MSDEYVFMGEHCTKEEILDLEAAGVVRRTGEVRDGAVVWELTPRSAALLVRGFEGWRKARQ